MVTGNKQFEIVCKFCGGYFLVPFYRRNCYKTCSENCSQWLQVLSKLTGVYKQCDYCNKGIYVARKHLKGERKYFCDIECDNNYRRNVKSLGSVEREKRGKKYYGENWLRQARNARKRDAYTCQRCQIGEELYGKKLSVHHIVPFVFFDDYKEANNLKNLISICEPCHRKEHSGELHPLKYQKDKLGKNYYNKTKNTVHTTQRDMAVKIVKQLLTTNHSLAQISRDLGVSYTRVRRIYTGERWKELYAEPPKLTNPRIKVK